MTSNIQEVREIKSLSELSKKLQKEIAKSLTEDILERYDNSEYHNPDLIDALLQDNGYRLR